MEEAIKLFIQENKNLLNNDLDPFLEKANRELTPNQVILLKEVLHDATIDFLGNLFNRKEKLDCSFGDFKATIYSVQQNSIMSLESLRELLLNHCTKVAVDLANQRIMLVVENERSPEQIFENEKLKNLFELYSNKTLEKAKNGVFEDFIHFITYHTVEKLGIKPIKEMIDWWKNKEIEDGYSLLGYYCNHAVYLCDKLIKERADNLTEEYAEYLFGEEQIDLTQAKENLYNLLYKKVFTHEFGHLVFDWVGETNREQKEKQANYFSSYINDGTIDKFIKEFTRRQPAVYHDPYLMGDVRADTLYKKI